MIPGFFVYVNCLVGKHSVLGFPLFQLDAKPEGIDAACDKRKQEPLNPVSEKLHGGSVELQSVSIYNGVLCFPSVHHAECPRIADA